jgi:STAS domain-containing protein
MIVPVFTPPSRIDGTNVVGFAGTIGEHVARHGCVVIDCSEVVWIAIAGMRVLEIASRDVQIALVNPSPAVHLMAAVFGGYVQCRFDQVSSPAPEPDVPRQRLLSVHIGGKLAS